jgi:hypothetical protein
MQSARFLDPANNRIHLPIYGQGSGPQRLLQPVPGSVAPPAAPPEPLTADQIPCAYQTCTRPASVYPVIQLPPPAATASGQPLRIVFRRNPACDLHQHPMVATLAPRMRAALTDYFRSRGLPAADWDVARWEFEPVAGEGR